MTRKALVISVLSLLMCTHMTACTSGGGTDDTSVAQSNDETFAEEGEGDFADAAKTDTAAADAPPADAPPADGTAVTTDAKPEDTAGDLALDGDPSTTTPADQPPAQTAEATPPVDAPPADAPPVDGAAVAATDVKPADDLSLDDPGALPADTTSSVTPPAENITDNPAAPSDAGVFEAPKPAETSVAEAAPVDTAPAVTEPIPEAAPSHSRKHSSSTGAVSFAPLMKVKDSAFTGPGGATLNRVYVARPKDTTKSISQKVYGAPSHSKDLVKWNPVLKRGVRSGDKVYYSSAANPSDSKILNYYEEAGVAPMTYVSKDGDNLRTVSKSLLGFNEAWKEVWVTNPSVESKGKIPAGLTLSYWPASGTAAPVQTMASTAPPTDMATPNLPPNLPSTLPDAAPIPPQANMNQPVANNAQPPADPFNQVPPVSAQQPSGPDPLAPTPPNEAAANAANVPPTAAATTATDPLAPPLAQNQAVATPPPPAVVSKPKKVATASPAEEGGMDPDTTMALGVGGVLLLAAAAILLAVIRKNRAKRMDLGQTQV